MTRAAWWLIGLGGLVLCVASTLGLLVILGAPGTRILVTNDSGRRLVHVVVHANDKALPIGPLEPNETRSVIARPGEGSPVQLEFTTEDGVDHHQDTTAQVAPNARSGRIEVSIRPITAATERSIDRLGPPDGSPAAGPEQADGQRRQDDRG